MWLDRKKARYWGSSRKEMEPKEGTGVVWTWPKDAGLLGEGEKQSQASRAGALGFDTDRSQARGKGAFVIPPDWPVERRTSQSQKS